MSAIVPIATVALGAAADQAPELVQGLASGEYERVGGAIVDSVSKELVAWLRDVPQSAGRSTAAIGQLGALLQIGSCASMLNLGVTVLGFAVVLKRLQTIESRIKEVAAGVADANDKLDCGTHAAFMAGLEQARTAFAMADERNRRTAASQAIDRFLETEHYYAGRLSGNVAHPGLTISWLQALSLACLTASRCYLEIGETDAAVSHLADGRRTLSEQARRLFATSLRDRLALSLHPSLASDISFARVVRLLRRENPGSTAETVFEELRPALWKAAAESEQSQVGKLWDRARTFAPTASDKWLPAPSERFKEDLSRLVQTFGDVEQAYEWRDLVEAQEIEVRYVVDQGMTFQAWQQANAIALPTATEGPVLLVPPTSRLFARFATAWHQAG